MLKIQETQILGVAVLRLKGDTLTYKQVEDRISQLFDEGNNGLVLDMEGLEYISSDGLRVIVSATQGSHGAGVRVAGLQPFLKEVFDISGLSQVIPIDEDPQTAAEYLARQ